MCRSLRGGTWSRWSHLSLSLGERDQTDIDLTGEAAPPVICASVGTRAHETVIDVLCCVRYEESSGEERSLSTPHVTT
jgi:hypothetical protein